MSQVQTQLRCIFCKALTQIHCVYILYIHSGFVVRKLRTDRRTGNFLFVHWITVKMYLWDVMFARWEMFLFYFIYTCIYIYMWACILYLYKKNYYIFRTFFLFSSFLSLLFINTWQNQYYKKKRRTSRIYNLFKTSKWIHITRNAA